MVEESEDNGYTPDEDSEDRIIEKEDKEEKWKEREKGYGS